MPKNEALVKVMSELYGCTARVSSGTLSVEGHLEGDVLLEHDTYHGGIKCLSEVQWNTTKPLDTLVAIICKCDNELDLSYDQRDKVVKLIYGTKDTLKVQIANISPYGALGFSVETDENGKIRYLNINYKNSIINIRVASYPKEEKND